MDHAAIHYFIMEHEALLSIIGVIAIPIAMGTAWEKYQIRRERRLEERIKANVAIIEAEFARNNPDYASK